MFKIGEFSKLTQVSIRMLRYYDEMGLLKPAAIDPFTNYRLYEAEQIITLNKIKFLRDLSFQVSDISLALNQWDDLYITQLLEDKQQEFVNAIESALEKLAKIEQAKKDILKEQMGIHYNVSIKSLPSFQVLSLRRVVQNYYCEGQLWKELADYAYKNSIPVSDKTFSIYHDSDYKEDNVDMELCACVTQMGNDAGDFTFRHTEPVPLMACTMVYGPFENISGAYLVFANWLAEHNQYHMGSHSRQIVHRGQWNEEDPDQYLTEIQIPLIKRSYQGAVLK